jgi:hypothetical protein
VVVVVVVVVVVMMMIIITQEETSAWTILLDLDRPSVDREKSLAWLCSSGIQGETESLIIAAQDQALNTSYHQRNIMKQPINCKCRMHNTCAIHTLIDTIRWLVTSIE